MPLALLDRIAGMAGAEGLIVMGGLHPAPDETLVLLGCGPGFWPRFRAAPEAADCLPDPVDRWSLRVIGGFADTLGASAAYPFGGPPYAPFIRWALHSGRAFQSPVGMLVHDTVGMMISYRGALRFDRHIPLPPATAPSPCLSCADQPCTTACPVGALSANQPYALDACHAFLDTPEGEDCMDNGCRARRACPLSAGADREPAQSAHHMKAFHPR